MIPTAVPVTVPVLTLVPFALYSLAAALIVRAALRGEESSPRAAQIAALLAVAAHSWLLFGVIRHGQGYALTIADSASLVGWVIGTTTLVALPFPGLRAIPAVLFVLAGLLGLNADWPRAFHAVVPPAWELKAHIALSMLAFGWLAIGAVLVVLSAIVDRRLRTRQPLGWTRVLPPMERMERLLFASLAWGFVALTASLFTGLLFVHDPRAQHLSHLLTLSAAAWALFAVLLYGRWRWGWRGRKALRFTLGGFGALALAYFGSKFVLEVMLGRHWG